jgi:hypothetical protein
MRRQIDYHPARARAANSGETPGANCVVLVSAEGLSRTLLRIHAARGLGIEVDVSPEHSIRGRREDLDEMLGNLLENACKWAKSAVTVQSFRKNGSIVILDDDGLNRSSYYPSATPHGQLYRSAVVRPSSTGLGASSPLSNLAAGTMKSRKAEMAVGAIRAQDGEFQLVGFS